MTLTCPTPPHPTHQRTMNMSLTYPTPPHPSTYHEHDVNMPHPTPPLAETWGPEGIYIYIFMCVYIYIFFFGLLYVYSFVTWSFSGWSFLSPAAFAHGSTDSSSLMGHGLCSNNDLSISIEYLWKRSLFDSITFHIFPFRYWISNNDL